MEEGINHLHISFLSIDLRKAFDSANLNEVGRILLSYGVPIFLINRIIKATLYERTEIQRRRMRMKTKGKRVKQGCPLSPFLFVVVMHYAISRVAQRLNVDLNYEDILLPIILAYADDIIIISDSMEVQGGVMQEIIQELRMIGLEIIEKKCSVLIRDPFSTVNVTQVQINNMNFAVVPVMKYLRVYLSANRAYHMLLPFLTANRLSWDTLQRLYNALIVPVVMYGIKVATITKQNRNSLRRMEDKIVQRLRELVRDASVTTKINELLGRRTIVKKSRVAILKYWGHIIRRPSMHILKRAMQFRAPGKRKIGRPCYTWNHTLESDMVRT